MEKFMENNKKFEIHVKGGFSERKGITHFSDIVQVHDLNKRTRNKLYSAVNDIFDLFERDYTYQVNLKDYFVEYLYKEIFSKTERDIPTWGNAYKYNEIFDVIYTIFTEYDYTEVFTFVEGIVRCFGAIDKITYNSYSYKSIYIELISKIFENENVNYRIIDDIITDIVNEEEIQSIEKTLENKYDVVRKHYSKALKKMYKDKDFNNSIKESISSVEAMCQIITGKNNATLGDALKLLKGKVHPAMNSAFDKLYGYTSNADGIRHANGLGEGDSTFNEAKYMLISCSAFVNYLKESFEEKEN
jgi:hypothetical protein